MGDTPDELGTVNADRPYWLDTVPSTPGWLATPPSRCDLVVVGGGIVGCSVAYWGARAGARVALLERDRLAAGATGRNLGLLLPRPSERADVRLWERVVAEEGISAEYRAIDHLSLLTTEEYREWTLREVTRGGDRGPVRFLRTEQVAEVLKLRPRWRITGGRLTRAACANPARLAHGLARGAARLGARICQGVEVLAVRRDQGLRVETASGDVCASFVVVACQAGSMRFAPDARLKAVPRRMVLTGRLPPIFPQVMALDWGTAFWRQLPNGEILLGGRHPFSDRGDGLESLFSELFEGFPDCRVTRSWSGEMDESHDGQPVVVPTRQDEHCWVVAGFDGHGLPGALGVGARVVAAMRGLS
ncbi:sarcosine oxidase subunit beta [Longimycelium tulufanense]|uniref:Sarcosine oxidase subunit beta n=1 Tax=Longimycelium tulufanense TaxID=907463 RepID=A0A8J3FXY8_9PSEU|nr:FAD-dependent oxidoreductase [Longimycelium tulufanense]GGM83655.1 sarcosine oxidase subunit beta [Longimycelium tulufanense]